MVPKCTMVKSSLFVATYLSSVTRSASLDRARSHDPRWRSPENWEEEATGTRGITGWCSWCELHQGGDVLEESDTPSTATVLSEPSTHAQKSGHACWAQFALLQGRQPALFWSKQTACVEPSMHAPKLEHIAGLNSLLGRGRGICWGGRSICPSLHCSEFARAQT